MNILSVSKELKQEIESKSIFELRELAFETNNQEIQLILSRNPDMGVRINLALNYNCCREVVDELAFDSTFNVVYCAMKNPNVSVKRSMDERSMNNRCVICNIDVQYEKCKGCM